MHEETDRNWGLNDLSLSLGVFLFLLVFTTGILFFAPYPGFYFNPTNGEVLEIYAEAEELHVGDLIESVNSISMTEFNLDGDLNLFQGVGVGDTLSVAITRNGEPQTIDWIYPGFTWGEFVTHFLNIWWLGYVFWGIGTFTQLFMRPKDSRWRLFVAMNYLMAMFIMLGAVSSFHIMQSGTLLRVVTWMLVPVYLHFHWIFPAPLKPIPRWLLVLVYLVCIVFSVAESFYLMPRFAYFFGIVLAFGGSTLLLIFHYFVQQEHHRELRILASAAFASLLFTALIGISGSSGRIPQSGPLALFALPILPIAYFYVSYRHRLGGLELRTNRAVINYLFLLLIGTILLFVLGYSDLIDIPREMIVFAAALIAVATTAIGLLAFPSFQRFVEKRLFRVRIPSHRLVEDFSARIIASNTVADLSKLLQDEVFPSLYIKQYAMVRNLNASAQVMLSNGVTSDEIREEKLTDWLASFSAGELILRAQANSTLEWVRLALPLRVGPDLIGVWLLGRRDPDDYYPQAEYPMLQSLANQTAIAMSNLIQAERLKSMYHANLTRYEQERNRLGRDLHDSVLNEMAAILITHEELSQVPGFEESYNQLIGRIRELVSDLRPPMLAYGLKFALEGLADHLSERQQDRISIQVMIEADGVWRYPEVVENYLYRIIQEACENALKYARAQSIAIHGELFSDEITIEVSDDGIGFSAEINLPLDDLVANQHFGLAGMLERADLIGATVRINSKPGQGTQIHVVWGESK